ncbi:DUF7523 family protein [Halostagnicola bangensis]
MSLASETRRAARNHPFLITALRAGVINYTAGARFLDVDGENEAVATALRRYAEELPEYDAKSPEIRVTMESGIGPVQVDGEGADFENVLSVGGSPFGPDGDGHTAVFASGAVDPSHLGAALQALEFEDIEVVGAGFSDGAVIVVVERLAGANAVRTIERVLEETPTSRSG